VEFILAGAEDFYFLEVNTRLQVEHPVTEAVTGLDLVRLQVLVAQGEPLGFEQEDLQLKGHAIEARLYAERPDQDFLPATGSMVMWQPPRLPGLRVDSGVALGSEIGIHYDPMLAKIIAHADTREEARVRLLRGLECLAIGGVETNRDFLLDVLAHPAFVAGELDTHFVERHLPPEARDATAAVATLRAHGVAAVLHSHELRRAAGGPLPACIPSGWRNSPWRRQEERYRAGEAELVVRYVAGRNALFEVGVELRAETGETKGKTEGEKQGEPGGEAGLSARIVSHDAQQIILELDGVRRCYQMGRHGERVFVHSSLGSCELERVPRFLPAGALDVAGGCLAPMTGVIRELRVAVGERVEKGRVLLVLEAMKMEHEMTAQVDGVVKEVRVEVDQMVDPDEILVVVEPED
jgi:propionyl-CoA carboxylase alpha chain